MNKPCARITLDLQQASTPTFVAVKKSDIGREIRITLSDGGFPYEISADCYAVLTGTKPDGNILYNHCDIVGNTIVYEITEQTTAAAGRMKAEVKLYGADDILVTSATFRIIIDGTVYTDDKVESSSEFSALTQLISQVVEIIQKYSDATTVTKTSELINDSGFITNAVTDLVNYYTKTDIGNLLSNIPKFRISVVSSLPTEDISETTIYLLSGGDGSDLYIEYLRVDGKWEILGSQRVDLTGYATEEWVEQKLEEHSGGNVDWLDPEEGEVFTSVVNTPDIPAPTLTGITASYTGGDVLIGTALSALVGIVVTGKYSDGTTKTVTDYTLSGSITEGSNTITVTYEGLTTTFTVTGVEEAPEVVLSSISATYTGGNVAVGTAVTDLTGITVTAHYSDGSSETVTDYTLSGTIAEGSNTITVSYGGKTATFVVTGEVEEEQEQIGQEGRAVIGDDGYVYLDVTTLPIIDGNTSYIDRSVESSGFATIAFVSIPMVSDTTSEVLFKDKFTYLGTSYSGIRNGTVSPEVQYGYGYDGEGGSVLIRFPYSDYESVGATRANFPAAIALHTRYLPIKLKDGYNTYSLTEEAIDAATYYKLPSLDDGYYYGFLYISNGGKDTGGTSNNMPYLCNYGGPCSIVKKEPMVTGNLCEVYNFNGDENQRFYVRVPEGAIADATTLDGWKAFLKSRLPIEWYGD